ncbi:proliferation marker protein Ki-67 isoform X3 [Oryzias latipes]|uniref:proliferation marker protein Ki-67 isoform X3 n=1 Tax=Oryzias latipes TaxID=8090 RepID=UPI0005CBAD40|nr:proliferation marker protein Ki-67 isoform X3 [Oryzias latipes]
MPLHGKIVVIKRSGVDGTEFPLTASCLFGRKPDCDIRIQLPQVSKEHCRIDLNENKEVILTNLSTANPTRVNGEVLAQSERLKHGDTITIVDRSFRFEYPPAPTPKKRSSSGGKTETLKVRQDQQVAVAVCPGTGEKRTSEVTTGSHLKDGAHHDNIQRSLEKTLEMESTEASQEQTKNDSPFSDLYHMIKKSLEIKTPCKSSASQAQTPSSKFCTPNPASVRKSTNKPATPTPENDQPKGSETPQTAKKQAKTIRVPAGDEPRMEEPNASSEGPSQKRRSSGTSQKFTAMEIIEQISGQTLKSPAGRRSKEATPTGAEASKPQAKQNMKSPKAKSPGRASPGNSGTTETVKAAPKKRKSGELRKDQLSPQKKKRVSFGGQLSPELFDKRLPPNSPLRKGATPRRSLMVFRPKSTLLRRASVIGLIKEQSPAKARTPSPKKPKAGKSASPKAASPAQKSPKSRSASPKAASPAQKSPKSKSVLPKSPTSAQKSPKSRSASPKAASPAQKSPKSKSVLPKSPTSAQKSPKSRSASPKAASPAQKSPKSRSASPKSASPAQKSPKSRSASPKAASPAQKSPKSKSVLPKSPTSAQKSPKSRSASPKAASPAQKSPKSRSASPKAASPAQKSPKSRSASPKAASPAQKSPKSRSASPKAKSMGGASPKTPLNSGVQTQTLQGRFSVSRISTPSPTAEAKPVKEPLVTPKIPIKRKSMKSSAQKTPRSAKSAAKMLQRRSGASRISMKALSSWAGIVKFGKTKPQVFVPSKKKTPQKTKKKAAKCKPQTPARVPKGHVSTGHADSPATIVVGRAHKKHVVVGAAPRVVTNTVLIKKRMKMDEDLTGISEMFQTPVAEKKRRSLTNDPEVVKTPGGSLSASVMSTPEESGEMIVSPLSVASAIKNRRYNSEAVQRLLDGEESSFAADDLTVNTESTNQNKDGKTAAAITPKQNAPKPEGLTGVKRIVKTPKQKTEPLEDLRGKILKTPKQKPEQRECLTGVKRIMKTPKHKAEPLEDLRGKILKTPKQKTEQQECLTGVKRIMKTPKHKAEPLEDLRGNLLKTPKQKPEQQECLTGVRRIFKTPQQEAEPVEDLREKLSKTPKDMEMLDVSLDGVEELLKTPANDEAKNPQTMSAQSSSPAKKTPRQKSSPVQDLVGLKRPVRTPKQKGEPVEDNFGIKRLMKSPRMRGNPPVEDFEGLQELMEEPQTDLPTDEDEGSMECAALTTEPEGVDDGNSSERLNESCSHEPAEAQGDSLPFVDAEASQQPDADKVDEINADKVPKVDPLEQNKKANRGRRTKAVESEDVGDRNEAPEPPEEPAPVLPVRGRRGKKTEATASSAVRPTRGRNAKISGEESAPQVSKAANRRETGRNAKHEEKGEQVTEDTVTAENQELEHQGTSAMISRAKRAKGVQNEAPVRAKRGRNAKHEDEEVDRVSQDVTDCQQASVEEKTNKSEEIVALHQEEPAAVEALTTKPRRGGRKAKQDAPAASTEVQEPLRVPTEKPVRGRRGKPVPEDAVTAENQELEPEHQETEERIGKPSRAVAPGRAKRGRNAKHEDEEVDKVLQDVTNFQQASVEELTNKSEEINAPHQEEPAAVDTQPPKPRRGGRKAKQDAPAASTEVQEPLCVSTEKPVRGRRGRQVPGDTVTAESQNLEPEHQETTEKVGRAKRTKVVQNEVPVRAKRGRNAKHEEKEVDKVSQDVTNSQQASVEERPKEIVVPQQEEPAKPRRGGRKAKQDAESVAAAPSTEVQEPLRVSTDKPVRGRRGKRVPEDAVTAESLELEPEHQETTEKVCKSSRTKREKAAQNEVAKATPVKRAQRGAAPAGETAEQLTLSVPEPAPGVAAPKAKRGRRVAAKQSPEEVSSEQTSPAEEEGKPVVEESKKPSRFVSWKADLEICDIPKALPVKAARGRKSKLNAHNENKNVSDADAAKGEELSGDAVQTVPAKRSRRGVHGGDVAAASTSKSGLKENEPQPKTRRGRAAKK